MGMLRQLTADFTDKPCGSKNAAMTSASNLTRTPAVKTGNYKEFISCQPFWFNGMEGAIPRINPLCPNMDAKQMRNYGAFIGGLPRSIEGNVTASKPQTLEEAINISQRLMDQIIKRDSVQETNDHKRKLEDKRNTIDNNNNYPKYHNNNNHFNNRKNDNYQNNHNNHNRNDDYHHQQNRRQEPVRTYPPKRYHGNLPLCYNAPTSHRSFALVKFRTLQTNVESSDQKLQRQKINR
ncbi:hypothetical protein Tco_1184416 [Tanacetum coccineum]